MTKTTPLPQYQKILEETLDPSDSSNTAEGPPAGPQDAIGSPLSAREDLVSGSAATHRGVSQAGMDHLSKLGGQIWHPDPHRLQLWVWPLCCWQSDQTLSNIPYWMLGRLLPGCSMRTGGSCFQSGVRTGVRTLCTVQFQKFWSSYGHSWMADGPLLLWGCTIGMLDMLKLMTTPWGATDLCPFFLREPWGYDPQRHREFQHGTCPWCWMVSASFWAPGAELKWVSAKTAFLLAITSAKRVVELHALSVSDSCLRWNSDGSGVTTSIRLFFLSFCHRRTLTDLSTWHSLSPPQGRKG